MASELDISKKPRVVIRTTDGRADAYLIAGDSVSFGALAPDREIVAMASEMDGLIVLTVEGAERKSMTLEAAKKLCEIIPEEAYTEPISGWRTSSDGFAAQLRALFPEYPWRVFMNRAGYRTRWSLTPLPEDMDPREHYVRKGGTCICCDRSLAELRAMGLDLHERDDDLD